MDYEKLKRALRNCPALWGDNGAAKEAQAARALALQEGWHAWRIVPHTP
jgi:hypothetical protein